VSRVFKPLPSLETLHSLFEVVPVKTLGVDSGLIWKVTRAGTARAGTVAGCLMQYHSSQPLRTDWRVDIHHSSYYNARIIYKMVSGIDPGNFQIDHIDRNPCNNNFDNLRLDKTNKIQNNNKRLFKKNKTGARGVSVIEGKKKPYVAHLAGVPNVPTHIGYFYCVIEAANAYNERVRTYLPEFYEYKHNDLTRLRCDCGNCAKILNRASVFEI